jgi:hypothetical protein
MAGRRGPTNRSTPGTLRLLLAAGLPVYTGYVQDGEYR